jgi:uncharacterized protein (DUF1697 family)
MVSYVALLRGIGPSNPNMRNQKLRSVFEDLGFGNVQTVISSGNVLFESPSENVEELEATVENALLEQLGFSSTTIIKSRKELQSLVDKNPFKDREATPQSKFNVTFLKNKPHTDLKFPYLEENKGFTLLCLYDRAVCSIVDLTRTKTPALMRWLEKEFSKEITTRTWKTVSRILKKLDDS